ncbi:zinc finger protein 816-like [Phymastichus coffea]|uniref:zinc finger protein 816-like n=1 Tax=Phymastichus coffea TaxID=108790 RepID=UPI00273CB166|nr:zinc finger protein 816-like [Phymastichus coffea]
MQWLMPCLVVEDATPLPPPSTHATTRRERLSISELAAVFGYWADNTSVFVSDTRKDQEPVAPTTRICGTGGQIGPHRGRPAASHEERGGRPRAQLAKRPKEITPSPIWAIEKGPGRASILQHKGSNQCFQYKCAKVNSTGDHSLDDHVKNICSKKKRKSNSSSKRQKKSHKTSSKKSEKIYKCLLCDKRFTRKKDMQHHIRHNCVKNIDKIESNEPEKIFKCMMCDKRYMKKKDMQHHIKYECQIGPDDSEKIFKCMMCDKNCTQKKDLQHHILYECQANIDEAASDDENSEKLFKFEEIAEMLISQFENFVEVDHIEEVMLKTKAYEPRFETISQPPVVLPPRVPAGRLPKYRQKQYYCSKCHRGFTLKSNLNRHFNLECGFKPRFKCPYCELRSKQTSQIYLHIRNRHPGHEVYYDTIEEKEQPCKHQV